MKQIKVELLITLDETVAKSYSILGDKPLDAVSKHIKTAIGNRVVNGWGLIQESEITDIKFKE
jgi:hypothetical protein